MITRSEAIALSKIHFIPMPSDVYGVTAPTRSGRYVIAINSAMPPADQARTLEHELAHIMLDHFDDPRDIRTVEHEADELAAIWTA